MVPPRWRAFMARWSGRIDKWTKRFTVGWKLKRLGQSNQSLRQRGNIANLDNAVRGVVIIDATGRSET